MKYLLTFVLFVIFVLPLPAQIRQANQLYAQKHYAAAAEMYRKAAAKVSGAEKADVFFQLAECERHLNHFSEALKYYKRAKSSGYKDDQLLLLQANMHRALGEYTEAKQLYVRYQQNNPADAAGSHGVKSCDLAIRWLSEKRDQWKVTNMKQLNTSGSDFAPTWIDRRHGGLCFTSLRIGKAKRSVDPISGEAYSDIYESRVNKSGVWSSPMALNDDINRIRANDGASCITNRGNRIYFTRSERIRKQWNTCHIWYANKNGSSWGKPVRVDFELESNVLDSFNFRHPTVSADGQVLIFSSDMPGSEGSDLWVSHWNSRTQQWTKPERLSGNFNTARRECFPYLHDDGTLYFASDGLPGMGGLDIFRAVRKNGNEWSWNEPENLRMPFNSPADDFGILFDGLQRKGYLSSNRNGGQGNDDIWYFEGCARQVQGIVRDCETQLPLADARVTVTPSTGAAFSISTTAEGEFSFIARDQISYSLAIGQVKAKNYFNLPKEQEIQIDADLDSLCTITTSSCLQPIQEREITFPAVLYALNSYELLSAAEDSLDYLYRLLTANPHIVIELGAHTDCRGLTTDNLILSQRRAQACVDYLVQKKGIDPDRLIAKGYGENSPLRLNNGQALTESYIASQLQTDQERLHQLNRRTVFRILAYDFNLSTDPMEQIKVKKGFFDDSVPAELPEGE
jgi:peptidoglycan-associated lipoprotein